MNDKTPLEIATDRLETIEQLLLRPTPQAIFDADALLEQVATIVAECARSRSAESSNVQSIRDFRILCNRIGKLLEGARRVQWIRMRLITSLSETYTARAEKKIWPPASGTVNVRM